MFLGLLVDGFHLAPRGMGALATPATDADLDDLVASLVGAARRDAGGPGALIRVPGATG